jgi:3-phenylpropionate/trans-cinnamate dioxygenase ferredoxin reductase component
VEEHSKPGVVIVGGGLAGSRTCVELRKFGYTGPITLIGAEPVLPYDRPPLSKAVIRGKRESKPFKADYAKMGIDVRLSTAVERLDATNHRVLTSTGPVSYSHLVIASGATPIRLPGEGEQLVLRSVSDATGLRDRLCTGARVVVIGASWIGAEVAHAALERGCRVTCIENHPGPLVQAVGVEVARRFEPWWRDVDLRTSQRVAAVQPDGVHLAGGELIAADVVVTGVGVRPATSWLADSGLELLPAVAVDEFMRTADPSIYAVGDAAAWRSRRYGRHMHVEHWDDAYTAPTVVATNIAHGDTEQVHDPVPYFWSDQFGHRIEYVGHHGDADDVSFDEGCERGWVARWTDGSGRLSAALGVDASKTIATLRAAIASGSSPVLS